MRLTVIDPGLFTSVQDSGRWGHQSQGMPVAGAMDRWALGAANLLAGNPWDAAALEMTVKGGTFRFEKDSFAAIAGADMQAVLDGRPIPCWSSFRAAAGSVLRFDYIRTGCRTYLALRGGVDVPSVQGSRSTYLKARIGGLEGRVLKEGDSIRAGNEAAPEGFAEECRVLPAMFVPGYGREIVLRVLPGPQDALFTEHGIATFFGGTYTVTNETDRMGCRLEGPAIEHRGGADIVSDALPQGAVQVPGHGMPIVMMADRQTTGGYAKIGTVLGPDLGLLAQTKPGDLVRFIRVGEDDAEAALREERMRFKMMETALRGARRAGGERPC